MVTRVGFFVPESMILRLRLYDRISASWEWRLAAYEDQGTPWRTEPPMDEGEFMLAVPRECATVSVCSLRSISIHNFAALDVAPVLEILPFKDLTVPDEYWPTDELPDQQGTS
jgi:hypothetical protein